MLNQIPRPILVFIVFAIGIFMFFQIQEPHTVCDAQFEILRESQSGRLFPRKVKSAERAAIYPRLVNDCKIGNSPGACFELFTLLRKLIQDLKGSPQECLAVFGEKVEIKKALFEGTRLITQLAWGDRPPEDSSNKFSWLEVSDLSLFCQLKTLMIQTYGEEEWEKFRLATNPTLPGEVLPFEAQVIENGVCTNCSKIRKAPDVLTAEEIWVRSLFSLRCEQYTP
jgi:hypothetical protein